MKRLSASIFSVLLCVLIVLAMPFSAFTAENEQSTDVYLRKAVTIDQITKDLAINPGDSTELKVTADGGGLSYLWELSTDGGNSFRVADGIYYGDSYRIHAAKANTPDALLPYLYRVTVTDNMGQTASEQVRVLVHSDYEYVTKTDTADGISVTGFIQRSASLIARLVPYNTADPTLLLCIRDGYTPLSAYEANLVTSTATTLPSSVGRLTLEFTTDSSYNGTAMTIYHKKTSGQIETLTGAVSGGRLPVFVYELNRFLIEIPSSFAKMIQATAGENGSISPSGSVYVPMGGTQTFVFTPHDGYVLDAVTVDETPVAVTGNCCTFTNVTTDHTIHAVFKAYSPDDGSGDRHASYTITVTDTLHGRISPCGTLTVNAGESKTFYFYPDEGYTTSKVLVNGVEMDILGHSYTFSAVTGNATLFVAFEKQEATPPAITYTINAAAGDHGKVSPTGETSVTCGGDLYCYFFPDEGYCVDQVLIDGTAVSAGSFWHFVNVTEDHTIYVSFRAEKNITGEAGPFTITVEQPATGGQISPPGILFIKKGGSQTFFFYPEDGYELDTVYINGKEMEVSGNQFTLEDVEGDVQISAAFKKTGAAGSAACSCRFCEIWRVFIPRLTCICPWCWLAPLLLLAAIFTAVFVLRRRKQRRVKTAVK